jgi:hypothetical protein
MVRTEQWSNTCWQIAHAKGHSSTLRSRFPAANRAQLNALVASQSVMTAEYQLTADCSIWHAVCAVCAYI